MKSSNHAVPARIFALLLPLFIVSSASAMPIYGVASFYKQGKVTANGEAFNPHGFTAAHRSLPFGTLVRVKNLANGKAVVVRINDRGPFIAGREIDLSLGAARAVDLIDQGVGKVKIEILHRP